VFKKIISVIPGFRTGRLWKKIIACIVYPILCIIILVSILGGDAASVSSLDKTISTWEDIALILFLVLIPFILITNTGGIRSNLPLFRSTSLFKKIMAWTLSLVIVFIGFGMTFSILGNKHSPEYIAAKEIIEKEQAAERAKQKSIKDAEDQVKHAREEKELAKKEAEKKTEKEAEKQTKLAKEELEKVKKDADKQDKLAEEDAQQAAAIIKDKSDAAQKEINTFEKNLKKRKTEQMVDAYHSSDDQMKEYMDNRINEEYLQSISSDKDLFLERKFDKIKELHEEIAFIESIPNLKDSDVGQLLTEIEKLIENNNALKAFKKEHPRLEKGIIKDITQVQDIDCYVNYRIKNPDTNIAGFTIEDGRYSDQYFISSYSYSELFGYTSSEDWEAVLVLSSNSNLSQAGIYETRVISSGTTKLIDNRGFEKEYPIYREVSQENIDEYYQVQDLIDQQSQLNDSIDKILNHITSRLS
jgi:chemotaxis protein histidine kinase CheA